MQTDLTPRETDLLSNAGVGRTSLLIAAWRAMEAEQIDPLVIDPIANIFVDQETAAWANEVAQASVSTRHLINYRTRYFDDYLREEVRRGVTQIVILGAGLDTRSLRLGNSGVTFLEVDRAEVLRFKRRQLERFGYFIPSHFIEADYIQDDWMASLEDVGFRPESETYFIWEGNTMYIPSDAILSFLSQLKSEVPRFKISFDFVSEEMIRGKAATDLVDQFENMDAKWVTGFADIGPVATRVGLTLLENLRVSDVVKPSPHRGGLGDFFQDYLICTLGHGG